MERQAGRAMISPLGRLRIAWRLAAMLMLLAVSLVFYHLRQIGGGSHNPWPRRFLSGIARIANVRVGVNGRRVDQNAVLIANHVSWIDIPALAATAGSAFVAHDGLAGHPLLRWLCRMNDTVFIARHDRGSIAAQVAQVREAIRDTGTLTIFPEGTTGDGMPLLPFKSSLLSAVDPLPERVSIQPVWLDYGADHAEIAWVGAEPGVNNFLRILARSRPVDLTVHFLPPLAGDALANRKSMAAAARSAILDAGTPGSH